MPMVYKNEMSLNLLINGKNHKLQNGDLIDNDFQKEIKAFYPFVLDFCVNVENETKTKAKVKTKKAVK